MLDADTKQRIDRARNILVGVLPMPQAQIDQITYALIYKFMDDMDQQSVSIGGKASFFTDEFVKFAWTKIFDPRLGGYELHTLYTDALAAIPRNPNIPQFIRTVFKNAILPYRNPETLKLFLKTINEFQYSQNDHLGDAFEYLLQTLGSQGDAGQFLTPRHIINFMVQVVDPKKNETILDPACGTAGFLVSSYLHILKGNQKTMPGDLLTAAERASLPANFTGYDISAEMVRLALTNLYLHGFTSPRILEYDSLTSEEHWDEYFNVILANPPFMSPTGGIRPHKHFSVQANRSEVLFVDYIAEHLTPSGRAAIIVPEGIIFQNGKAYKQLRKMLVEQDYLWAVVSLPSGVFNPYSGVKTSILFLDKELAKKTDQVLFIKIENDGFSLGANRTPIDKNDLPEAINVLKSFQKRFNLSFDVQTFSWAAKKTVICENSYDLRGETYKEKVIATHKVKMVALEELLDYEQPTKYIVSNVEYDTKFPTPVLTAGKTFILGFTNEKENIFSENLPVIIFDDFTTASRIIDFPFKVKSSAMKILHPRNNDVNIKFVYHMMSLINFDSSTHKRYWISEYSKIKIPLPPLEVQREIVAEIEGYQRIIEDARKMIDQHEEKIRQVIARVWESE